MEALDAFWHRLSLANGSGVQLALDRRHPFRDDLHLLQAELIGYMMQEGKFENAYFLCNLAERYANASLMMRDFEITSYMMMAYNMLKAELHLPFDYKGDEHFDLMFKAFIGLSVLLRGQMILKERRWKRFT